MAVVDFHSHWYPESYLRSILDRDRHPRTRRIPEGYRYEGVGGDVRALSRRFFDLEVQFETMDDLGIDVMVGSPNLVGDVVTLSVGEARETAEMLNEEYATAQKAHPDRFVGLAMVPLQDADVAAEVLERAVRDLGLAGVCLVTHVDEEPIAGEARKPFYDKVADLDVPIFLHPAHRSSIYKEGQSRPLEAGLNWVYDTSAAALSLILSGTLDSYPEMEIVHPHIGGVLPYVIGRIDSTAKRRDLVVEDLPETRLAPSAYLKRNFYADTVGQTPGIASLAVKTYGESRILFGTDFPWQNPRSDRLEFVLAEFDDERVRERILHRNSPRSLSLPKQSREQ